MKAMILTAALTLSACGLTPPVGSIPAPVTVADRTIADEQAAIGVELAYKAFRAALELAVDAGVLTGSRAATAADADRRVYGALLAMRGAYKTANSADFLIAAANARAAIERALKVLNG